MENKKRYGVLICAGTGLRKNIGDYIQSIAQQCFLPRTDVYVEREQLKNFHSEIPVKTIMNAWYMWNPENFPPSDSVDPLFLSVHIAPMAEERFFSAETIAYMKRFEPIGARDTDTMRMLEKHGIKSYFSGCLTLTLGQKYHHPDKDGSVYIVDPYYQFAGTGGKIHRFLRVIKATLCHFPAAWKLRNQIKPARFSKSNYLPDWLYRVFCAASFYADYSKLFTKDVLLNAHYVTHEVIQADYPTEESKFALADELLQKYTRASLVITSRIHAALPCIGMGTDVVFVNGSGLVDGSYRTAGRFGGLVELMHTAWYSPQGLCAESEALKQQAEKGKIGIGTPLPAPSYAHNHEMVDAMAERIRRFMAED